MPVNWNNVADWFRGRTTADPPNYDEFHEQLDSIENRLKALDNAFELKEQARCTFKGHTYYVIEDPTYTMYRHPFLIHDPDCIKCSEKAINAVKKLLQAALNDDMNVKVGIDLANSKIDNFNENKRRQDNGDI